jgi:hypothetical protein
MAGVGFLATGRIAWILAMVVGVILIIVGAVMHPTSVPMIIAGCLFFVIGLIFLIASYVTGGASD